MIRIEPSLSMNRYIFIKDGNQEMLAIDIYNLPEDETVGGLYIWTFYRGSSKYDVDMSTGKLKVIGIDEL